MPHEKQFRTGRHAVQARERTVNVVPFESSPHRGRAIALATLASIILHLTTFMFLAPLPGEKQARLRPTNPETCQDCTAGLMARLTTKSLPPPPKAQENAPPSNPASLAEQFSRTTKSEDTANSEPVSSAPPQATLAHIPEIYTPYYSTSELTLRPQPMDKVSLDPPGAPWTFGEEKLSLTLWIDSTGSVVEVVADPNNIPRIFSDYAITQFRQLRFSPAEINGSRVGVMMRIQIHYKSFETSSKQRINEEAGQEAESLRSQEPPRTP